MLNPGSRQVYLEQLRPPAGYVLDRAIATTFSLDLLTLLMAPLSMALHECQSKEDALKNPVAVLDALRRTTDRLAIFCQEGRIQVPSNDSLLYRSLEPIVVQVRPPQGEGVFHPKIWLMRFACEASEEPIFYRFLCLSRNLTFDRSWDTVLRLDGFLEDRQKAFSRNHPLSDFISALPTLAVGQAPTKVQEHVKLMADEALRVRFEPPEDFDDFEFLPLGIEGYAKRPKIRDCSRMLIVSPFLSDSVVDILGEQGRKNVLISRPDTLDELKTATLDGLEGNTDVFFLDDQAEKPEPTLDAQEQTEPQAAGSDFSGLHAKLYILETNGQASVLTGSANATTAGLDGVNVEFLVRLSGMRRIMGVNSFLGGDDDKLSFRSMLHRYTREGRKEPDKTQKQLENALEAARRAIAKTSMHIEVVQDEAGKFQMTLKSPGTIRLCSEAVTGKCFPISLQEMDGRDISPLLDGEPIVFQGLSLPALTGFVAFVLNAQRDGRTASIAFVLNLPVTGMPADRDKRLLREIISDRSRFLRYLMLILANEEEILTGVPIVVARGVGGGTAGDPGYLIPLLEELVRAFSRYPEKIDRIARLVEDVRQSPDADRVLPPGFDGIWNAFLDARKEGGNA